MTISRVKKIEGMGSDPRDRGPQAQICPHLHPATREIDVEGNGGVDEIAVRAVFLAHAVEIEGTVGTEIANVTDARIRPANQKTNVDAKGIETGVEIEIETEKGAETLAEGIMTGSVVETVIVTGIKTATEKKTAIVTVEETEHGKEIATETAQERANAGAMMLMRSVSKVHRLHPKVQMAYATWERRKKNLLQRGGGVG